MFDFYGTVVDMQGGLVEAITPFLTEKGYTDNPASRVVTWWRRTHFENSMIDALLHREHTPYREIGRQAVAYTLERAGIVYTRDEVESLVSQIERLRPFGAKAAGMRTAFVDRRGRPFGNETYPPDAVVADFAELATVLGASQY